jgi:hypothetical protein
MVASFRPSANQEACPGRHSTALLGQGIRPRRTTVFARSRHGQVSLLMLKTRKVQKKLGELVPPIGELSA